MTRVSVPTTSAISKPGFSAAIILTTILGVQLIRGLLPYLQPLLGERLGWGTVNVGLFALAVFLCAFLAGPLNRFLGSGLLILICGLVIGLSRLAAQFWTGEPILDMIYATTGVIAFVLFLPTAVGLVIGSQSRESPVLAVAILAGLALDLALNGVFFSYDLFWQSGLWPTVIITLLVLSQWWVLYRLLRQAAGSKPADARFSAAISGV